MNRFTKILEKVGLSAFSKNINIVKDSLKHDIDKKANMMPVTQQQYNELITNGSTVIDGKTVNYDADTYYVITDDCEDLNRLTGDIEFGTFNLPTTMTPAVDDIIPIDNRLNGNIEYDNGYKLKKGKTYLINVNIGVYTGATTDNAHLRYELRFNSNSLIVNGVSIPATSTSPWGSTPLSYTLTPTEDGVLTVNCRTIENVSGVLNSLSNLSIIEIPNPVSIANVTDNHINEVVKSNIAPALDSSCTNEQLAGAKDVYNSIENVKILSNSYFIDKGITSSSTLDDIVRVLPSYRMAVIQSADYDNYLGLPNAMFTITIARFTINRIQIIATEKYSPARMYIGICSNSSGSDIYNTWKRVCTTNVYDISSTKLTIKDSSSTGNIYYQVKNGECTVSGQQFRRTASTGAVNNVVLVEGLPKCTTEIPSAPILYFGEVKGQVWMSSNSTDLKIAVPTAIADTGENCVFTIKYPVSES